MMSSSISSTIKEVQGSSSGQKVQQVLTLSKLTGSTLQFSTSVEVRLGIVGSLVRLSAVFPENRAQDFSDFLHECSLL